ncbi:MAG: DcrB-related protein [Clostridia bacterium]|nr:DcrB-related protein [Clostridia bacterium]
MLKISKRIIGALLLCTLILCAFVSCSQDNVPEGYQLIACEGDEFRLYVPAGWQSSSAGGITSAIYSMDYNVTVSVYVASDAGELPLEEYWALCDGKMSAELEEYSAEDKIEKVILGGKAAIKTVYSAKHTLIDAEGKPQKTEYKYMQVTAKHNENTFVLLYSAPADKYDTFAGVVEGDAEGAGIIPYFVFAEPYHSADNNKQYSNDVETPDGMKLISTDERAYRFFVPTPWTVNVRTEATAAYIDEADGTRSNVSVQMYMTGDERQTVAEYFVACEKSYKNIFDSYVLVSDTEIKMDGISAHKYVYEITSGGKTYRQLQAIVKKGAMFYVVTYTSAPEHFDSHTGDVEKMIESFDIR